VVLDTTLKTEFTPGTNLRGDLARADWRFLLPSLRLGTVFVFGLPSLDELTVLSGSASQLYVASFDINALEGLERAVRERGLPNVEVLARGAVSPFPLADHSMNLIWLAGGNGWLSKIRQSGMVEEFRRLLASDGAVYYELRGILERLRGRRMDQLLSRGGSSSCQQLWQTPLGGDLRTAVPVEDRAISEFFFAHVTRGHSLANRIVCRTGEWLSRRGALAHASPRLGVLIRRNGAARSLPRYLAAVAERVGVDLSSYRFGFSARAKYNANKAVFYLFEQGSTDPRILIKITRGSSFNFRLENEYRVLSLLKTRGYADPGTYPNPLFLGEHGGLAVLGEDAVPGHPFRSRTTAEVDCPMAQQAVDWIIELGARSAHSTHANAREVSDSLFGLLERFLQLYPLEQSEKDFLEEQIAGLGRAQGPFPTVCQHGDPGTWNLLVTREGRVVFLDWEAGEPQGIPLWDLFYFLRSFVTWCWRVRGNSDTLRGFREFLLRPSPWSALLVPAVEKYCARVGLHREFVKPLFYTCWMHRALKECTRLRPDSLREGHYFNLLRLCLEHRNAASLAALFGEYTLERASERSRCPKVN
jgi:hypothetical protein